MELQTQSQTASDPSSTQESLQILGLTKHQSLAFFALHQLGAAKPSEIARLAGIPRPNTYDALEGLVGIGAATELTGKPKRYRASPPKDWLIKLGNHLLSLAIETSTALEQVPRVVSAPSQLKGWSRLSSLLHDGIKQAHERIVVDAHHWVFPLVEDDLRDATRRGCEVAILCRGATLPISSLSGWLVANQVDDGAPDSCWVFDQDWALRYCGSGKSAHGKRLLDPEFAKEIDRGILGQMVLSGDISLDSTQAKAIRRLHSVDD